MQPTASNEYQTFVSAVGFKGQPLASRLARSGLLMKGLPKAIKSARPLPNGFFRGFPSVTAIPHERPLEDPAEFTQGHGLAVTLKAQGQPVKDMEVGQSETVQTVGRIKKGLPKIRRTHIVEKAVRGQVNADAPRRPSSLKRLKDFLQKPEAILQTSPVAVGPVVGL
jgi:hypothetical protein